MKTNSVQNKQIEDILSLTKKELVQSQILLAEAENELLLLFKTYLTSLGMKTETAANGAKALDYFEDSQEKGRHYDAIFLDTHLINPTGLEVAKRIRSEKPDQKLVLLTTTPKEYLPKECLDIAGIKDNDILTMPFKLSTLVAALKN
ncbi:MAG TPA: response regulator [Candidatus Nitrosocosmicus sp.]|nr:response regulator [Candidatus Nitrosocosmicus sp.]